MMLSNNRQYSDGRGRCYGTLDVRKEKRSKNFTQFQAENKACNCIHSKDKKKKKKIAN